MLVSASFYNSAGCDRLFYSEFADPSTNNGFAVGADHDQSHSVFGNGLFRGLRVQALYGSRKKGVPTASYGTVFNTTDTHTTETLSFIDLQYTRTLQNEWDVTGRLSYNRYHYYGNYVFDYEGEGNPPFVENKDVTNAAWWGTELNASKRLLQKHRLTLGMEFETTYGRTSGTTTLCRSMYISMTGASPKYGLFTLKMNSDCAKTSLSMPECVTTGTTRLEAQRILDLR